MLATSTIEYLTAWATLGTAVATFALAVGTFYMALKTRDEARATREDVSTSKRQIDVALQQVELSRRQADAAELAIVAQSKPVLIDVPYGTAREPTMFDAQGAPVSYRDASEVRVDVRAKEPYDVRFGLPLRNEGTGLARVVDVRLDPGFEGDWRAVVPKPNIPVGERARFVIVVEPGHAGYAEVRRLVEARGRFAVSVTYTDVAGGQTSTTRVEVGPAGTENWRVDQVFTGAVGDDLIGSIPVV